MNRNFFRWVLVVVFHFFSCNLANVAQAAVDHFQLSHVDSPQHLQVPFGVTVTARDSSDEVAADFSGGVTIWGALTNAPGLRFGFEEGDFSQWTPLNLGNTPGPYEIVPFDVAGHGTSSLAFRLAANSGAADGISRPVTLLGGTTYFLSVELASMNENGGFANGDPGTAHLQMNGQEIGTFNFGVFGYIYSLQIMRTNLTASFIAPTNGVYQLALRFDRGAGQSEVWNYADNLRISAAPFQPLWLGPFTNGVWSGNLALNFLAQGFSWLVEDAEAHLGAGNSFDVAPAANLALQVTNSPAAIRAGSDVTFTLQLTNRGPSAAANIVLSNILSGDVAVRSATNSFGTTAIFGNAIVYSINSLTNGRLVTLTATVRPHELNWITNRATVTTDTFDPDPVDNEVATELLADLPWLHVSSPTVAEGNSGTNLVSVPVWLEGPVSHTLALDYATTNGTAVEGADYLAVAGTVVFPPDVVTQYIQVPILADLTDEPNRTVTLLLSNAVNAVLAQPQATLTIGDDDPVPPVSIADVSVLEGNYGRVNAVFPVTLANPSSAEVRITCATSNGSATSGTDYTATTATLIFPAGTTNQNFLVPVFGDGNNEPDQTFLVTLSAPVNCAISRGTATGTILNDDGMPGRLLRFAFDPVGSPQYRGRGFPLTIRALDHLGNPATSFTGSAYLSALTDGFYIKRLLEDFEDGDLLGWTNYGTASLVVSNVNDVAVSGTRSLRLTGKGSYSSYAYSLRYTLTNSRPNKVSFYVRGAQTNAICGRTWLVGGAGYRAFDFYLNKDGRMGLFSNSGFQGGVSYVSNRWYKVDLDLNWTAPRKVSCSIDGVLVVTNLAFLDDTYSGADWIAVQNTEMGTSWFDDFHVYDSYPSNLVVTPTTVGTFSGGSWTGNVTVSLAANNAFFSVTDNAEHTGASALFEVRTAGLGVIAPVAITEGSAPVAAQVTIPLAFPQNLVVSLTSSVPAELTVPSSVTILAGQTNATFNLTVVDDAQLDGSQRVTISASHTNLLAGSAVVSVDDNEATTLTLALPVSVAENAGTLANQGRITLAAAPAKAVLVNLSSSDTNLLRVPATVTVNAGQTTATFNLTVVDNPLIDGYKNATVSAAVANWVPDVKDLLIVDNEDRQLRLSGPGQISEEGGSATYTARISGLLATNLELAFLSSDPNVLMVPSGATIPAGVTNASFSATIVDNVLFDGAKAVQLAVTGPGFFAITNSVTVLDNEIHHLGFATISGTKTSSVPFSISVTARDILDGFASAFTGTVTLTGSGPGGACIVQPASINLVNGSWSGAITVYSADAQVGLQVIATNGLSGQSNPFDFAPPTLLYVNVNGGDLAYSPVSRRIWALVGSSSTLVPIDPFTAFVESAVSAGPGAGRLVTSADGRYLHIVGSSGTAVRRFDTLTRTIDLTLTNGGLTAVDLSASPTNSGLVAVSWACPGCSPQARGVVLYEGGIARSNVLGANQIDFGDSPDELFWYNTDYGPSFGVARVDASGLVSKTTLPVMGGWSDEFICAGGKIFSWYGGVYDQRTSALIAGGSDGWRAPADQAVGRLYTVGWYTIGPITAYDLETMLPVAYEKLPGPFSLSALIRWGSNGLAFCASSKVIVLRTPLLPTAPATDLAVSAAATNLYVLSSNSVHCPLTIANAGTNAASGAALAVRMPANVSLTSATCDRGYVTNLTASTFICILTNLPAGGQAAVDMVLVGGLPGVGGARISLTGDNVDLNRSNNLLNVTFQVGSRPRRDSLTLIQQATSDLAWSAQAGRLLLAVQTAPLNVGPSLLPLDPLTGQFDDPISTGFGPNRLSVHPAGRYVYAGLDREMAITRVDLSNRVADLKFPTGFNYACDVAVVPDDPSRVVAAVPTQTVVYQSGVRLPNTVEAADNFEHFLDFSSLSPDIFYLASVGGLRKVQVNANGAAVLEGIGGLINGYDRDLHSDSGWVFTAGGRIFDPEAKTNIAVVPYGGLVAPDAATGKVFYLNGSGSTYNLVALNFTNQQWLGMVAITNVSGTPGSLVRWGADGLAFRTTGGQVFLVRTTLADDRDEDGLADSWEQEHFLSCNAPNGGPNDDPDHDGFTNWQEQRTELDPLAYDAVGFRQLGFRPDGAFQMEVLGQWGVSYRLMSSSNLVDWTTLQSFSYTNPPCVFVDPAGVQSGPRFYRLAPPN